MVDQLHKPRMSFRDRMRASLVAAFVLLSALSFLASFVLSWAARDGASPFLIAGVFLAIWASVTATCARITVKDVCGILHMVRGRPASEGKNRDP